MYTIGRIKYENKRVGHFFFSPDTLRFFSSRVSDKVYQGVGGVYFVTSEQFNDNWERRYTVRQFHPESGHVSTIGKFNELSSYQAHKKARELAHKLPDED